MTDVPQNDPPARASNAPRCLFTDELLSPATKVEHTIPESLGGRIESKTVSSTTFNEEASKTVDPVLAQAYAPLFNRIGPLTPGRTRPGSVTVQVPGAEDGKYVFESGGQLKLRNIRVLKRDEKGRPKVVEAADEEALRNLAKQMGVDPAKLVFTEALTTNQHMAFADSIPVAKEIELGALKSVLLTFDHLLSGDERNFTRHPLLAPVREMVRRAVIEKQPPSFDEMNRVVLGLQYDRVADIRRLREASKFPHTPFEHVLVASGKAGTRTLDAAWLLFDSDPLGFRLSNNWTGGEFTCVVVSGVVRDSETYGPYWYGGAGLLLPYTDLRSHPTLVGTRESVQATMQKSVERVAAERHAAHQHAVDYVERNCDDFVRENLALLTRLAGGDGDAPRPIARGLELRLQRMFHERLRDDVAKQKLLAAAATKHVSSLSAEVKAETIAPGDKDANHVSWPAWIAAERAILDEVRESIGLPGDVITRSIVAVADVPGERPVGMPPPIETK